MPERGFGACHLCPVMTEASISVGGAFGDSAACLGKERREIQNVHIPVSRYRQEYLEDFLYRAVKLSIIFSYPTLSKHGRAIPAFIVEYYRSVKARG